MTSPKARRRQRSTRLTTAVALLVLAAALVTWGVLDNVSGLLAGSAVAAVPEIAQVPRYAYGAAARGLLGYVRLTLSGDQSRRMAAELAVWNLVGRLYGRHVLSRSQKRSRT